MENNRSARNTANHSSAKSKRENESRRGRRRKVYLGELTSTEVTFNSGELNCEIVDLSLKGVGVVADLSPTSKRPERGESVHVSYSTRSGQRFRSWGVVTSCEEISIRDSQKLRIGVAYIENDHRQDPSSDAHFPSLSAQRINVPEGYAPLAFCEDPFFFRERIHFQIGQFSPLGMTLETKGFHATLLPNVVLPLTVFLPMIGQLEVEVRLANIKEENDSTVTNYRVEVVYSKNQDHFRHAVSEYLLLSHAVPSVDALKSMFFPVDSIDRALSFRYANSAEDYETIMLLRGDAMDKYDGFSRHILCSVGDKVIACARLVFTDGEPVRSELDPILGGIPAKYWVQRFLESSKFCCLEGFSARDVYFAFLKHFVRICAESRARYLMTTCSSKAIRLYEKIGFKRMKPSSDEQTATPGTMVVVLDVHRLFAEKGLVDAGVWKHLYAELARHIGTIETSDSNEKKAPIRLNRGFGD